MKITKLLALSSVVALTACASMDDSPAIAFSQQGLPNAVKVPNGHVVSFKTLGAGLITYECRATKDMPGRQDWVFVGPDASLFNAHAAQVGRYYGPPATWESLDGSRVTATQLAVAPGGAGNIPLQLVKANPAMGAGSMQGVSYIQRLATQGGVAPAASCSADNPGDKQKVAYQADYIFWRTASRKSPLVG